MKRTSLATLYVLALGLVSTVSTHATAQTSLNMQLTGVPEADETLAKRLQPYTEIRRGTVFDWLPHGDGMLIGTRFGNTQQLHIVKRELGARTQITFEHEPINFAISNRNTQKPLILFAKDNGGNEQFQLYLYDLLNRSQRALTANPELRHTNAIFSSDGLHVTYARADKTGDHQICSVSIEVDSQPNCGKKGKEFYIPMDVSADRSSILLHQYRSVTQSTLFEWEVKRDRLTRLTPAKDVAVSGASYSLDQKHVYVLSDQGTEHQRLFKMIRNKPSQLKPLTPPIQNDVEDFTFNSDESQLAVSVNINGSSKIVSMQLSPEYKVLGELSSEPGVLSKINFHPSENKVLVEFESAQVFGDAYVLDTATQAMARYTEHEAGGLRSDQLILPSREQYIGGKGEAMHNVQAWLYRPQRMAVDQKAPVLVMIHGGPESQARPTLDPFAQFVVKELGIAVLVPNIRGSTGYSRSFTDMDNGALRANAIDDLESTLDWIKNESKGLDAERVVLMGGSYGGFMTLVGLTRFSARLKGGVDIVGISDMSTFLKNTSNYRRDLRRAEYGDERGLKIKAFFDNISPLKNASQIKVPLFVIQGFNDPRVPASEAAQIASEARKNDVMVWEMTAMDEGHGFRKKPNIARMQVAIAQFLRETLQKP